MCFGRAPLLPGVESDPLNSISRYWKCFCRSFATSVLRIASAVQRLLHSVAFFTLNILASNMAEKANQKAGDPMAGMAHSEVHYFNRYADDFDI